MITLNFKFIDQIITINYQVRKYLRLNFKIKQIINKNSFPQEMTKKKSFNMKKEINISKLK